MEFTLRWLFHACLVVILPLSTFAQKPEKPSKDVPLEESKGDSEPINMQEVREELGVNEFTAPSIEKILAELMDLRPIQIEKVWSDLPVGTPQDRARLALASGRVIVDGLVAVIAEKPSRIEPCARALLRFAKGLGVSDHVTKHSKSVIEKAMKENWLDLRRELVKAQADVEAGMLALKDEEIAHLVSLGGWLRGLDVVSTLVAEDYTPERAGRLVQPEALDYFIDRIGTLNPDLREKDLFKKIEATLKSIRSVTVKKDRTAAISLDDVKRIRDLAHEVNLKIADTGAQPEE